MKKLQLNKQTIAQLGGNDLGNFRGGRTESRECEVDNTYPCPPTCEDCGTHTCNCPSNIFTCYCQETVEICEKWTVPTIPVTFTCSATPVLC